MRGVIKRKKAKLSASSNFNQSISTYGKNQLRFVNDIPCSNWLPSDDSFGKSNDSLSSISKTVVMKDEVFRKVERTTKPSIFDSDSEEENVFKPQMKKQKIDRNRNKKSGNAKAAAKQTKRKRKGSKKRISKSPELTVVKPKTKCESEKIPFIKEHGKTSESPEFAAACNWSFCKSVTDNCNTGPETGALEQIENLLAVQEAIPSQITDRSHSAEADRRSIVKRNPSQNKCFDPSVIDSSVHAINRVSFNSTVMFHAANIQMNSPKFQHSTDFQLGNSTPVIAQSTPLFDQRTKSKVGSRNPVAKIAHGSLSNKKKFSSDSTETLSFQKTGTFQVKPDCPTRNTSSKRTTKKPIWKKKSKKPAVWKKKGGLSFCSKGKIEKSNNNSILHKIMIGKSIDPKYDFFEDSADAYFVNSGSHDTIHFELPKSHPTVIEKATESMERKLHPCQSKRTTKRRKHSGSRSSHEKTSTSTSRNKKGDKSTSEKGQNSDAQLGTAGGKLTGFQDKFLTSKGMKRNLRRKVPVNYQLMLDSVNRMQDSKGESMMPNQLSPSTSSFSCTKLSSASLKGMTRRSACSTGRERNQDTSSPHLRPSTRHLRPRKPLNYKNLSNGSLHQAKRGKFAENSEKKIIVKSPNHTGSEYEKQCHEKSVVTSPDMFAGTSRPSKLNNTHRSPVRVSNHSAQFQDVRDGFICERYRRKRKTTPHIVSKESSLFSTLSFNSEKNPSEMSVAMHAFSTIRHSYSDEEKHGNILSDDENVKVSIGTVKRISTPIAMRSPAKSAQTLYSTTQKQPDSSHDRVTDSELRASPLSKVGIFSPIMTTSDQSRNIQSDGSSGSFSCSLEPPLSTVTHPRIAVLKQQEDCMKAPSTANSQTKQSISKEKTPFRRRARSPASHLSSSIIKVDHTSGISEVRRRTLDLVKVDLSSAILDSKENGCEIARTPSHERMLGSDVKVLVTPMNKASVEQISSSGNRIRIRSLGLVDALTPKRARSGDGQVLTAREKVLYECEQITPQSFEETLLGVNTETCTKLGEGLYGEVFRCEYADGLDSLAIKIIPIEGPLIVNNEVQKTFVEVLPEIISSKELHSLRHGEENSTSGFIKLHRISCVIGRYPEFLLDAWDAYDEEKESENDRPDRFPEDQLYLIFQYADGGTDVEHFKFTSAAQAFSVLQQVSASLAVAEECLEFEHRDLHWGNILVHRTTEKTIFGKLHGKEFKITTRGVRANIIDFTLSRLSKGGVTVFQNLAADPELFRMDSQTDYQFDIYRMMKNATRNNWSMFQPKNNVFWLHYLNDKFRKEVKFTNRRSALHRSYFSKLKLLEEDILQYNSCVDISKSKCLLSLKGIS